MLRCEAVVTRITAEQAEFRVAPRAGCNSCQQGRGCGMALFERKQSVDIIQPLGRLRAVSGNLTPGALVELRVPAEGLLGLSFRAYLLPLMAAAVLAGLLSPWGDLPAAMGLLLGLAGGYGLNRQSISVSSCPDLTVVAQHGPRS